MRTFYSEYVSHALRFYVKHPDPVFRSDADRLNHEACKAVIDDHPDKEFLVSFYRGEAKNLNSHLWKIIADVERRVAVLRGLL